ncbi:MAG: peroxiredoxin [Armatimonadota bacterium]|nr:peroxiredoxin [Armatimonadota bacterium]MDR7394878.1 peroxiredoxin [Armatimonadota bacterium]MDR7396590.1 peroxiredoxin [Armatimonadota bacterium]MDR7405746.1 peroxiredoxin [Armatimonadota bacterium]MDR7409096.1 peroxiredoxin [Armatimonadota bacterium]
MEEGGRAYLPVVQDAFGRRLDLAELAHRGWLVLFFYPKAGSPGCSLQARRYRALEEEFRRLGATPVGVSPDPAPAQCAFAERTGLTMLPDPEGALARAYGVRRFLGVLSRDTVLVNRYGRVERIWRRVNPLRDADRVLAYLRDRQRQDADQSG